jgi:hypothetical protein
VGRLIWVTVALWSAGSVQYLLLGRTWIQTYTWARQHGLTFFLPKTWKIFKNWVFTLVKNYGLGVRTASGWWVLSNPYLTWLDKWSMKAWTWSYMLFHFMMNWWCIEYLKLWICMQNPKHAKWLRWGYSAKYVFLAFDEKLTTEVLSRLFKTMVHTCVVVGVV